LIDKKILLRLLETAEAFLKKKATIGQLREAVREAKRAMGEA
jgi:hypothetical protein